MKSVMRLTVIFFVPCFHCLAFQMRGWIIPAIIILAADDHHSLIAQRHVGNLLQPNHPGQGRHCAFHLDGERWCAASQCGSRQ